MIIRLLNKLKKIIFKKDEYDEFSDKDKQFIFVKNNGGYKVKHRGVGYFKYIGSEKVVEIPHVIEGHKMTSYYGMFEGSNVKEVISTNKNITDMSYMFYKAISKKIILYNFDTSNVKNMDWMFSYSSARQLDLYNFNTSKVESMSFMFSSASALKINLSSFDTKNVVSMSCMFLDVKIKDLNLSSFNTSNVTSMRSMFEGSNTTELDLSSFDTSNVTNMDSIFKKSRVSIGYARTQEDADRFNESRHKPNRLNFIAKP